MFDCHGCVIGQGWKWELGLGVMVTGKVRVLVRRRHERKECVVVEEEVREVERGLLCEVR
jgi:hypothetical protein